MKPHRPKKRFFQKPRSTAPGSPPGAYILDPTKPTHTVKLIGFNADSLVEMSVTDFKQIQDLTRDFKVTWVNIDGLPNEEQLRWLVQLFNLHPLAVEDVINTHQRSKVEEYEHHLYIVARMLTPGESISAEQLSIFLGKNYVLTIQETPGDCFDPIRERIRRKDTRIRRMGSDYLAYAILDSVVDYYFPALESLDDQLEKLEEEIFRQPSPQSLAKLHAFKRDLQLIKRCAWPQRDAIGSLVRRETAFFTPGTMVFLRDCYDHAFQLVDLTEYLREASGELMEFYLSSTSFKLNEIMKVLTIISTIFIPLSFIASLYGMNFNTDVSGLNMPELHWRYGYPMVLAIMVLVAMGLLAYFLKKGWLGKG